MIKITMTMGKLFSFSLFFFAAILVGSPVRCMAANLRASSSFSSSEESITVTDSDLVGISSYLVVQVKGYEMSNLEKISPEKQAVIDCAFHKAFDEVHGDRDGLYLSGQQIVATDRAEDDDDTDTGVDDTMEGVGLDNYRRRRPRIFPDKPRTKPEYPPPKPPRGQYEIEEVWNIYWHMEMSGRCNMCPDDDSMEVTSHSLLLNSNQNAQLALDSKNDRDQRIASDFVMSEASVNTIADAFRKNLIEGSCALKGGSDDSFEYVQDTDIYVLSQGEFQDSIAAIAASREARTDTRTASTALLPFHYGESSSSTSIAVAASANRLFRIGLSGVGCGPWDNTDLLDMNSGLHDSINSMGFVDKGHVIDKIMGGTAQPRSGRRYVWKCHFDVYAKLDLAGIHLNDAALDDIGDVLCDNLIQFGGEKRFKNAIDCQLSPLTASEYEAVVTTKEKIGLPLSSFLA